MRARLTRMIRLRATPERYAEYLDSARREDVEVSEWIRRVLDEELARGRRRLRAESAPPPVVAP